MEKGEVETAGENAAASSAGKQKDAESLKKKASPPTIVSDGPFCYMCGWKNPAGAQFCSACGTELQVISQAKPAAKKAKLPPEIKRTDVLDVSPTKGGDDPPGSAQRLQLGVLVVAGVLIVAALYLITAFSRRAFPEVEPASEQAQTETVAEASSGELPEDVAARIAALESEAAGLQGEALILKKREIVSILSGINRPDRAAPLQEEIAGLTGTSEDWFNAGHFFYDWMDSQTGEMRFTAATRAANAYEKGLELDPDDLNIRTALAMAYLNTRAPMQGVQQIRQVLETDPDHLQGNFYYGVMLMQINRLDQARVQFERVKELVGPESPLYQQAEMMLQNLGGVN